MQPSIAHDLGRRVEPHRLGVQQRAAKHIGVVAFQPGRGIRDQRETRGMTLRKTVTPKPLDLGERAFGEIPRVATFQHPRDHLVMKMMHPPGKLERRHTAAQSIGLVGRKTGAGDGDPHRLLLEQRHPQGFFQDPAEFRRGVFDRFQPLPAA